MNISALNKLRSLEEQMILLENKFNDLSLQIYPNKNIKDMIDYYHDVFYKLKKCLEDYLSDPTRDASKIAYLEIAVRIVYAYVGMIESCDIRNQPTETMIPIMNIINTIGNSHVFITEPKWEFNYAVGPLALSNSTSILRQCDKEIYDQPKVIRLLFPKLYQNNILYGAVMSHEIGHYLDLHYTLDSSEKILVKLMSRINLQNYLKFFVTSDPTLTNSILGIIKSCLPSCVMRNWINEIVADIVGIILYGPASYFSCEHVAIYYSKIRGEQYIDSFSKTHPRNAIRNVVRYRTLEKMRYFDYMDDDLKRILHEYSDQWKKALVESFDGKEITVYNSVNLLYKSTFLVQLEKDIKDNIEWIIDDVVLDVESLSEDIVYNSTNFSDYIPRLVKKLVNLVPPNELDCEPVDSISIINAGWYTYLLKNEELKPQISSMENYDIKQVVNNLIKKALNAADVHRRWKDVNLQ